MKRSSTAVAILAFLFILHNAVAMLPERFPPPPSPLNRTGPNGPLVISNRVVYGVCADEKGKGAVISVDANSGTKLWHTHLDSPQVWTIANGSVLASSSNKFFSIDLQTGALEPIFQTRYPPKTIHEPVSGQLLILNASNTLHNLNSVATATWSNRWTHTRAWRILHHDTNHILALTGAGAWDEIRSAGVDQWFPRDNRLALLFASTGKEKWSIPTRISALSETSLLLPDSVLLTSGGELMKLSRESAAITKQILSTQKWPLPLWLQNGIPHTIVSNVFCAINHEPSKPPTFSALRSPAFFQPGRKARTLFTKPTTILDFSKPKIVREPFPCRANFGAGTAFTKIASTPLPFIQSAITISHPANPITSLRSWP